MYARCQGHIFVEVRKVETLCRVSVVCLSVHLSLPLPLSPTLQLSLNCLPSLSMLISIFIAIACEPLYGSAMNSLMCQFLFDMQWSKV